MAIYNKDLTEVLDENNIRIKQLLEEIKLNPRTKELVLLVMEFASHLFYGFLW